MALSPAIEGARHTAQEVTWLYDDGAPVDLTGATISGFKRRINSGVISALDGSFAITDAANGVFTWTYGAGDVGVAGSYQVQFVATYAADDEEKTQIEAWKVLGAMDDEA